MAVIGQVETAFSKIAGSMPEVRRKKRPVIEIEIEDPGPAMPLVAYAKAVSKDPRTLKRMDRDGEIIGFQESDRKWVFSIVELSSTFGIPKEKLRADVLDYKP